jgi:hypothetical protein
MGIAARVQPPHSTSKKKIMNNYGALTCSCGTTFTASGENSIGTMDAPSGYSLAMFNCPACGSTRSIKTHAQGSDCAAHDRHVEDRLCIGYLPAPRPEHDPKRAAAALEIALKALDKREREKKRASASSVSSSSPDEQR